MNIHTLSKKPKVCERIFELSPQKFKKRSEELALPGQEVEYTRKNHTKRKHAIGGGRWYMLTLEQSLAMYLLYIRTYTPYNLYWYSFLY
jgi:hypothetical protein